MEVEIGQEEKVFDCGVLTSNLRDTVPLLLCKLLNLYPTKTLPITNERNLVQF